MRELMYVAAVSLIMSLMATTLVNLSWPENECTAYKSDTLFSDGGQ